MALGNRLVFKMVARIARIDTAATTYDHVRREPVYQRGDDIFAQVGARQRTETLLEIPVQVLDDDYEKVRVLVNGDSGESFFDLTAHRRDLTRLGLVRSDGQPALGLQDRLDAIYSRRGELQIDVPSSPGLWLTEIMPRSFGLSLRSSRANLWFLRFTSRDRGARA